MCKKVNVIYDMSEDARIREMVWQREKALHDEVSALENAEARGIINMIKSNERGRGCGYEYPEILGVYQDR